MPKTKLNLQLPDVLLARQLLSPEKVKELLKVAQETDRQFEDVLLEQKLLKPRDLVEAKIQLFNLPFIDLTDRELAREVVQLLPFELAENYQLVTFEREGNEVSVAMVNPGNFKAIEAIE
ncbi:MAG: hypothetical protein U1C53_01790, partial [Candidatus Veblenbacteria bacterium]|nr:hypothetical protein [Candidatus Veblenbacteria bacterium]